MDWDGSLADTNRPTLLGSAESEWWRLDDECVLENDWHMWSCKASSSRQVAFLEIEAPGAIENSLCRKDYADEGPYLFLYRNIYILLFYFDYLSDWVGNMTLWGPGVPNNRTVPVSTCVGVTGATGIYIYIIRNILSFFHLHYFTGIGWLLRLRTGPPVTFTIDPAQMPAHTSVIFAIQYPQGTTFMVNTSHAWNSDLLTSPAYSFEELRNGNGGKYFFDGTHLYLSLQFVCKIIQNF